MKNRRRRQGATLGLVAVCVLVIIVLGIGAFFLAKIFGGGREVANATDAGALNIAKFAMRTNDPLKRVSVSLPGSSNQYTDFLPLADPPGSNEINLLTYNRAVAQTLLVALNAQDEKTSAAATNAGSVISALNQLGVELKNKLQSPDVVSFFGDVSNDTRMWGKSALNAQTSTYTTAFMKQKESTNVYFTPNQLPTAPPSNWSSIGTTKLPAPKDLHPTYPASTGYYIRGYENIEIPGVGSVMGVPVFPQQNPHLVSLGDFKASQAPTWLPTDASKIPPPNAFSLAAAKQDEKSGVMGGAIAAAIVGAATKKAGGVDVANFEYAAAVPGGYLAIVNAPSAPMPADGIAFNQEDNIFNNELYLGPGIAVQPVGSGIVFSNKDMGFASAWAAYNNSSSSNPSGGGDSAPYSPDLGGKNKNIKPGTGVTYNGGPHDPTQLYFTSSSGVAGTQLNQNSAELLQIKADSTTNCLDQMNKPPYWLSGNCLSFLGSFEKTFNHYGPAPGGASNSGLWTNIDLVKGQIIAAFQTGQKGITVSGSGSPTAAISPGDSGLGIFANGVETAYPQPAYNPGGSIQTTGTIDQLLTQVTTGQQMMTSCSKAKIIAALTQRCYEIKPSATASEITNLWNTPLPIAATVYIYLDTKSGNLACNTAAPPTYVAGTKADGQVTDANLSCENKYSLDGNMIDVEKGGGHPADNNLHDRPYTVPDGAMAGHDKASLQLSSGYQNLLGQLSFANSTEGVENFSRPN